MGVVGYCHRSNEHEQVMKTHVIEVGDVNVNYRNEQYEAKGKHTWVRHSNNDYNISTANATSNPTTRAERFNKSNATLMGAAWFNSRVERRLAGGTQHWRVAGPSRPSSAEKLNGQTAGPRGEWRETRSIGELSGRLALAPPRKERKIEDEEELANGWKMSATKRVR